MDKYIFFEIRVIVKKSKKLRLAWYGTLTTIGQGQCILRFSVGHKLRITMSMSPQV